MTRTSVALLVVALSVISGCGSRSGDSTSSSNLMGPPPQDESITDAAQRIESAIESGDCDRINALNPLGRPGISTEKRCRSLSHLAGFKVRSAVQYGKLGGVIVYERGARRQSAILVRDADGEFHIAFKDPFTGTPGTTGNLARQFEVVAKTGLTALADGNCEAFSRVAFARFGLWSETNKTLLCDRVRQNLVSALLEEGGDPDPVDLDGGSSYAFFGVRTPASYVTLIAAKETDASGGLAVGSSPLPKGAPTYGIVESLRTNPREPIEGDSSRNR